MKKLTGILIITITIYIVVYIVISINGKYTSRASTIKGSSPGRFVIIPKESLKEWEPFPLYDDKSEFPTLKHIIFFPMVFLDQKYIHPR
jgi:hypothetical protein